MTSNNEYLFAKLNSETAKPTYSGLTTDSVKLTVDNENMTISGDVIWDSILGEVAHKAYPGDKGVRNYKNILALTTKLNTEIEAATKNRKYVVSELDRLAKQIDQAQSDLASSINDAEVYTNKVNHTLTELVQQETKRSITAEKKLLQQLNNEIGDRTAANLNCIQLLDSLSIKLISLEKSVQEKLEEEIDRSISINEAQNELLQSEIDRAKEVEKSLNDKIINLQSTYATSNDNDLLSEEIKSREAADASIICKLQSEIDRSLAAEKLLEDEIADIVSQLEEVKAAEAELRKYIFEHDKQLSDVENLTSVTRADLLSEISLRNEQWKVIRDAIASEEKRAINKENYLNDRITTTNEVLIAIRDRLTAEINSRTTQLQLADEIILDSLYAEYNDRVQAIMELDEKINVINGRFDDLANSSEIVELNQKIDAINVNIITVENNINELTSSVRLLSETVEQNRVDSIERDAYLQSLIENFNVGNGFVPVLPTTSTTVAFTQTGDTIESIEVTSASQSNVIVRRNSEGNIELNEAIESFTNNDAVSKSYVDSIVNEKTAELITQLEQMLAIEFIDGGTAPLQ